MKKNSNLEEKAQIEVVQREVDVCSIFFWEFSLEALEMQAENVWEGEESVCFFCEDVGFAFVAKEAK